MSARARKGVAAMREIIFRGKEKDTPYGPLWRYGDLTHNFNAVLVAGHVVDDETVGQYTGRKDRNGVLMFEGDLVELPNLGMTDKAPAEVVWNEDDAKFELFGYDTAIDFSNVYSHEIVVVGNIYENPELGKSRD